MTTRDDEIQQAGQLHRARLFAIRSALRSDPEAASTADGRPIVWVDRAAPLAAEPPVAFLASLRPGPVAVYRLKRGINRVGHDPMFGDFAKAPGHFIESRQWLLTCLEAEELAYVADDHSTNQSAVLSRDAPPLGSHADPRTTEGPFPAALAALDGPGSTRLDWRGNVVAPLADGDLLLPIYGPFVFGWCRPRKR